MELSNINFKGIKFNKSVPAAYKNVIKNNTVISQAAKSHNINVSLREAHCKEDNDTWKILKFRICKKGLLNALNPFYTTVVSSKNLDDEVLNRVKNLTKKDFLG